MHGLNGGRDFGNALSFADAGRISDRDRMYVAAGVLAGSRCVTAKYAIRLAVVLRTSALYWLVLQARYDLAREERGIATTAAALDPPSHRS